MANVFVTSLKCVWLCYGRYVEYIFVYIETFAIHFKLQRFPNQEYKLCNAILNYALHTGHCSLCCSTQ